jgi:hypothetical protein
MSRGALAFLLLIFLGVSTVSAGEFANDVFSAPGFTTSGNCCLTTTFTYDFTVSSTIFIGGLGAYSASFTNPNGQPEDVALYDGSGTELVSGWISSTDPSENGYNWISIPTLALDPGNYALSVYANGNELLWSYEQPITNDGVTWVNEYYSDSYSNDYQVFDVTATNNNNTDDEGADGNFYYGPNMSIVPEPSPLLLVGTGLLGLAIATRYRLCRG